MTKNEAAALVLAANVALAAGNLSDAKAATEAAYRGAFAAYPSKWAQDVVVMDLVPMRFALGKVGVVVERPAA
jgi:hypothetical protein